MDFNSPIWQKTVIAQVAEHQDKRKENENEHTTKIKGEVRLEERMGLIVLVIVSDLLIA